MNQEEAYALAEEQKQIEWEARFAGREQSDLEQVNQLLSQKNYAEIKRLYDEEQYGEFYNGRNSFVPLNLAMRIFAKEEGYAYHVLWDVTSVEALDEKLRKLRFLIWQIEYVDTITAKEELLQYVITHQPSSWLLKYLISATAFDETKVMLEVAKLFLEWNMEAYAESLVSYLEKK